MSLRNIASDAYVSESLRNTDETSSFLHLSRIQFKYYERFGQQTECVKPDDAPVLSDLHTNTFGDIKRADGCGRLRRVRYNFECNE